MFRRLSSNIIPSLIAILQSQEYAERFAKIAEEFRQGSKFDIGDASLSLEKPEDYCAGWKRLIMDPEPNGSRDIPEGLRRLPALFWGEVARSWNSADSYRSF